MTTMKEINNGKVALYCFGNTANGELGFGGIDEQSILLPRKQKSIDTNGTQMCIKQIVCGRNHTLLLLTAHTVVKSNDVKGGGLISTISRVYSCGSNDRQQLGREGTWRKFQVIPELNNHLVVQISCGYNHSLVLTEAGQVFAFGCNLFGQLAVNIKDDDCCLKPTLIKKLAHEYVVQISCGGNHSLALTKKGDLYSWGSNAFGQLGNGESGNCQFSPVVVSKLSSVPLRCISAGGSHSMAVSYANNIYVWGKNEFGQLGLGDTRHRCSPTFQPTLSNHEICYVSCGDDHSAAITKEGGLFTWGAGMYGQLGHGKFSNELLPRRVCEMMGLQVTQVSCGRCHTLVVIGSKGRLYSFGLNGCGQLGIGTQSSESSPVKISGPWVEFDAKEVSVRATSGPIVELGCLNEENVYGEWKENLDESMSIEDIGETEVFTSDHERDLSPTASPSKASDNCSPIIEEPEEMELNSNAPNRESVEISEYISDPDSDCEIEKPLSSHYMSSLGGSVPGNRPRLNHVKLLAASASKGDQSFVLTTRLDIDLSAVDYRNIDYLNSIYVFDNTMFENMLLIDADDRIPDEIIEYIENTFGSVTAWNGSYLSNKYAPALSRFDWEAAYYGFNCLRKCSNQRLTEIALNVVEKQLIPSLPTACGDGLNEEILRVFVLLPLFHLFQAELKNNELITELFSPYSRSLKNLNECAVKSLDNCWSSIHKEYFQNLIKAFKQAVIFSIKEISASIKEEEERKIINRGLRMQAHSNLKDGLDLLRILNHINQRTKNVSYKEFYIPELHESADIRMDYMEWLSAKSGAMLRCRTKPFYFCDYPFVFDVNAKTLILSVDSAIRQQNAAESAMFRNMFVMPMPQGHMLVSSSPFCVVSVDRNNLVNSTATQLLSKTSPDDLKKPLKINFENEEVIDAGAGVKKEFFILLMKELLDSRFGKFTDYGDTHTIWFNAGENEEYEMQAYELVGLVCGLAIYNQVIIYLPFPLPLYKKLLNEELTLDDLSYLDPYLTKSLKEILDTSYIENEFNAVYGDLNFTISLKCFGEPRDFDLCVGGKDKPLTYANRKEYVNFYWNFILNKSVEKQFAAFNAGFRKVVESNVLTLFHAEELMQLVIGQCVYDWVTLEKEGTHYKEPFHANHETIQMFWKVFHSFTEDEKRNFLLFLTGSDRIPILGIKALGFLIQPMKVSDDHLPVTHTCFNVLDLPEVYSSEEKLKKKLLQAIQHTHGFTLA